MPKRKVRGARAPGAGPPLPPPPPLLPPPLPQLWGARIDTGLEQAQQSCAGARDGVRRPRANLARLCCPRAPEAILEERRPRREEPCWRLFIPFLSGSTCPPRAPSPISKPPPLPAGGQFKSERAGRRRSGLAGGGKRCRQNAAVRGRGPSLGRGFALWPRLPCARDSAPVRATAAYEFPGGARLSSPALDGCHGNGARAPPLEGLVCTVCSCCLGPARAAPLAPA